MATCYMCSAEATSKEHVPPKCLFPEAKDLGPGVDLRKNLITVPSCDVHNSDKSKDDEYLLFGLTLNILNNGAALTHFQTKVLRALNRNPGLLNAFAKVQQPVIAVKADGTAINSLMVEIDNKRFISALDHVAQGVYYHKYQRRLIGHCSILPDFMLFGDAEEGVQLNEQNSLVVSIAKPVFDSRPEEGSNPEIFSYVFLEPDRNGNIAARLRFFEGSAVYVSYIAASI